MSKTHAMSIGRNALKILFLIYSIFCKVCWWRLFSKIFSGGEDILDTMLVVNWATKLQIMVSLLTEYRRGEEEGEEVGR